MTVSQADWERRQHRLNLFTGKYLKGVGPLREDGDPGPATRKRIKEAKYWLGWMERDTKWSEKLAASLRDPKDPKPTSRATVKRGKERRRKANLAWVASHTKIGVTTFDGVRVARWLVPYLKWARAHGWKGRLVSGYRSPAYSASLCQAMCGAPSCPGRCAGKASNHSGSAEPHGAMDVSWYDDFGRIIAKYPGHPRIFNALGSRDPVHFSATGR